MNRDHEFFINIRNSGSQEIDSLFYAVVIGFSKFCVNFAELSIHTYFNQWIFRDMRDRLRRFLIFFFFFFFFFFCYFASKIVSFTRNYSKVFINFAVEIIPKSIIKIRVYGL